MTLEKRTIMLFTIGILSIGLIALISPVPFIAADEDNDDDSDSGSKHDIVMWAVEMPDGLFAYKMESHSIDGKSVTEKRYGADPQPSMPGPTIIINEGDEVDLRLINKISCENWPDYVDNGMETPSISHVGVHVHGVHYMIESDGTPQLINKMETQGARCDDGFFDYHWEAARGTAGTWPYHDHTLIKGQGAEDYGLFGTLIINEKTIDSVLLDGKFKSLKTSKIDKEFVLWMVSSEPLGRNIFYGMEIDHNNGGKQTPLWVNPVLVAQERDITRWHIIGLGDEFHAFHLHAHRWNEQGTFNTIDTREIAPIERHTFVVRAGEGVGPGDWMYHCHVFFHMEQGMSSIFRVLPRGTSAELPDVGAVFAMSDEPGHWFKTINRGALEGLDPREGTGFPLDFLVGEDDPFADTQGRAVAVIAPHQTVLWTMKDSETKHTVTSLVWPSEAEPLMPNGVFFDSHLPVRGSTYLHDPSDNYKPVAFETPGLYAFVCQIHPYMFSAVVVDDPETPLFSNEDIEECDPLTDEGCFATLDLGEELTVLTRLPEVDPPLVIPAGADEIIVTVANGGGAIPSIPSLLPTVIVETDLGTDGTIDKEETYSLPVVLLQTVLIVMDPANWKDYTLTDFQINFPPVALTDGVGNFAELSKLSPTYNAVTDENESIDLTGAADYPDPGVGEVWVNTQFERSVNKNDLGTENDKPGTITVVDTSDWSIERKISLPEISMNNPHNMWANAELDEVYQTQWFDKRMAIIDRESGELIKDVNVGESPSHVMTAPNPDGEDKIYIAMNGEEQVTEIDPNTYEVTKQISAGAHSHPHGHWISPIVTDDEGDHQYVVTPNFFTHDAAVIDLLADPIQTTTVFTGLPSAPIATGMDSDGKYFFTADFLGNTFSKIKTDNPTGYVHQIDIVFQSLAMSILDGVDGIFVTGIPVQTPVSPDDKYMVTANVLGSKITVVNVDDDEAGTTDAIVAILPCDPGCHGVQWGAKDGGGYYAYVSNKFSNALLVVDPDPGDDTNLDGDVKSDGSDAAIVGVIPLTEEFGTDTDDKIIGLEGMGGQGILSIPNVYNGWIQDTVISCGTDYIPDGPCSEEIIDFLYDNMGSSGSGLNAVQRNP